MRLRGLEMRKLEYATLFRGSYNKGISAYRVDLYRRHTVWEII
jgi:hypothetical protein